MPARAEVARSPARTRGSGGSPGQPRGPRRGPQAGPAGVRRRPRARRDDLPGAARRSGLGGAALPSPLALAAGNAAPRRPAGRPQASAQSPQRAQPGPGEAADSAKAGQRPARQAPGQRAHPAPRHAAPAVARRARPHLKGTRSADTAARARQGGFPTYAAGDRRSPAAAALRWPCGLETRPGGHTGRSEAGHKRNAVPAQRVERGRSADCPQGGCRGEWKKSQGKGAERSWRVRFFAQGGRARCRSAKNWAVWQESGQVARGTPVGLLRSGWSFHEEHRRWGLTAKLGAVMVVAGAEKPLVARGHRGPHGLE